jgi:hypothetical protein
MTYNYDTTSQLIHDTSKTVDHCRRRIAVAVITVLLCCYPSTARPVRRGVVLVSTSRVSIRHLLSTTVIRDNGKPATVEHVRMAPLAMDGAALYLAGYHQVQTVSAAATFEVLTPPSITEKSALLLRGSVVDDSHPRTTAAQPTQQHPAVCDEDICVREFSRHQSSGGGRT